MLPNLRPLAAIAALFFLFALACAEAEPTAEASSSSAPAATSDAAAAETVPAAARKRSERPLPAFEGTTLEGQPLSVSSFIGRRLLLVFFNPDVPSSAILADALVALSAESEAHNFQILGVAQGTSADKASQFMGDRGLSFPTLYDASGSFIRKIAGKGAPTVAALADGEGNLVNASASFPSDGDDPAGAVEQLLRGWLRLHTDDPTSTAYGERPAAPLFSAPMLESEGRFDLSAQRGQPLVLIFFLHTCPHCHHALESMKEILAALPEATRPKLVGISVDHKPYAVRAAMKEAELDFFPILFDPDESIRASYGAVAGVPVTFLIDAEGRIAARVNGWRDERDPALMKMRLAKLAGESVPMLLHSTGYSGNEFCGVCHEEEHTTWQLTNHAGAFDTLVRHGDDGDGECVSCHVVGYGKKGGWTFDTPERQLEGVGCETCHGRGGPHRSPDFEKLANYESICATCHNPTHSLGFDYASFLPKISHSANRQFASLSEAERSAFMAERRKPREDLLPTQAAFVGSDARQSCHAQEFETWSGHAHARAFASLESERESPNPETATAEAGSADCLKCHTTGLGKPGGFEPPTGGSHPDQAAVGCESCHGPGGDHVGEDALRRGTILSLGDKCDSCVILQICGGCHDDANDPGFEFEVQDKIDAQRHGTIPPSTDGSTSEARLPASTLIGLLESAFSDDAS
ncbi:MAG: redoxin domain-containing protein [bacterium]|nr:redoxin domain-containing protein [bacterium]